MTHISLFTGIGGLDLAAEWAGFETVLQVERDTYALRVLEKHWPDVPRITDVREVTSESVSGPVTVVSGGFPCQPFSAAGKRRGVEDDRYLWPELLRIVEELQPSWVIGENVSGLLSIDGGMEIDRMLAALEARDYTPWILHYPAAGVGAPHKRDRVFIVGHAANRHVEDAWSGGFSRKRGIQRLGEDAEEMGEASTATEPASEDVANTDEYRLQARRLPVRSGRQDEAEAIVAGARSNVADTERSGRNGRARKLGQGWRGESAYGSQWELEPDVGRVAARIPHRVDRLRALGNAVVPQQAYPIFAAIAALEHKQA